jgi:hypothetical protein
MLGIGACGLDESGESGDDASSDVTVNDGAPVEGGVFDVQIDVPNDVALPPTCSALDLSCLGLDAGAPDGWAPFVVATGSCPSGDYAGTPWETNARLANGACNCGCTSTGTYACPNQITVVNGGNCMNTPMTVDAGACTPPSVASSHMELPDAQTAIANNVACAPDASAATTATDPVTLCSIGCDAGAQGLCGQPQGTRCIATDGIVACPSGLTQRVVGSGAVGVCNACGCKPGAPPPCTASAEVFYGYFQNPNPNCSTAGQFTSQTITLNQTCQNTNYNYDSFTVSWQPLTIPACQPAGGGGGAALGSPKTVCCN